MPIINKGLKKFLHPKLTKVVDMVSSKFDATLRIKIEFNEKNQTNTLIGSILSFKVVPNVAGIKPPTKKSIEDLMKKLGAIASDKKFPKNVMLGDECSFSVTLTKAEEKKLQKQIKDKTV